ncbi:hypothetical protein KUCAC02_011704, partial [Chaenocephalus aceratus]
SSRDPARPFRASPGSGGFDVAALDIAAVTPPPPVLCSGGTGLPSILPLSAPLFRPPPVPLLSELSPLVEGQTDTLPVLPSCLWSQ